MKSETQNAVKWFSNLIKQSKRVGKAKVKTLRGKMLFMIYDPKTKDVLPYYDTQPLILVLEVRSNYILGLNFHYLGYADRRKLVAEILSIDLLDDDDDTNVSNKLRYTSLDQLINSKKAYICLKKYYTRHIKNWMLIPSDQWGNSIFLPLYNFQKENATYVWKDSSKKISDNL